MILAMICILRSADLSQITQDECKKTKYIKHSLQISAMPSSILPYVFYAIFSYKTPGSDAHFTFRQLRLMMNG
jgi:hypothetical protein